MEKNPKRNFSVRPCSTFIFIPARVGYEIDVHTRHESLLAGYARKDFSNLEIIAVRVFIVNCHQFLRLNFLVVVVCVWMENGFQK